MGKDLKDSHLVHQKELQQFVLDAAGAGLQELVGEFPAPPCADRGCTDIAYRRLKAH